MRKYARTDSNHQAIVKTLQALGCSVQSLASLGCGVPDLLVYSPCTRLDGKMGVLLLAEVKDGTKPPSQRRLTQDEQDWINRWKGPVFILNSVEDAVKMVQGLLP